MISKYIIPHNQIKMQTTVVSAVAAVAAVPMQTTVVVAAVPIQVPVVQTQVAVQNKKNLSKYICNNCGKCGHLLNTCKLPITSYGIIAFSICADETIKYLIIQRKHTFGYIDFMLGRYSLLNTIHINNLINEMSTIEKQYLLSKTFDVLWEDLWGIKSNYTSDRICSNRKFSNLQESGLLQTIILESNTSWNGPEWEFPKGRRHIKEKEKACALREFEEETGITSRNIHFIENVFPYDETFIGTNYVAYKHRYFIVNINVINCNNCQNFQKSEVSDMKWVDFETCISLFRPYNLEKIKIITSLHTVLTNNNVYSAT